MENIMNYKQQFIKFMVENGVLKFGEFTLKSGRKAPYFINTGNYKSGAQLARLGEYYAQCIADNHIEADTLVGPAYKGIPLAVTCAVALYNNHGKDLNYCFDRKEVKDHGEGGLFVGKQLEDGERVILIEDVMTSGKALREMLPKLEQTAKVKIAGMIISVDRMERGLESNLSAVQEVYKEFGVKVYSIVTMADIIEAIEQGVIEGKEYLDKMKEYRKTYGVD
jgi:orotate phosphoribosyltransferase